MNGSLKDAIPLKHALRDYFPPGRTGRPVALSTGIRWKSRGIIGPDGNRVFLEAVKIGGVMYITPEAAERFVSALNADRVDSPDADCEFLRRAKAAGQALEGMGIL